jgi:hypothetical protein
MSDTDTYMKQVLAGDALLDDIDDYVSQWHEQSSSVELPAYLGMSWEEYSLWVEQPKVLRLIIAARERSRTVAEMLQDTRDYALAARGGLSEDEVRTMRIWLQETGRLPQS